MLSNLAALYCRIVGQGKLAVKCLRHSLYYSDNSNKVQQNLLTKDVLGTINSAVVSFVERLSSSWMFKIIRETNYLGP